MKLKNNTFVCIVVIIGILSVLYSCKKDEINKGPFLYAYFKADKTNTMTGDSIHFDDLSLGYPDNWNWTFEGASPSSSTEENPTVVYDSAGTFKVTLTISNGSENSSWQKEDYIKVVPAINLKDHLIAFFPFDGSAKETISGIKVNNIGNVTFDGTGRHSNSNSAAVFDGSSALIIPDGPVFNFGTSDFTISCWIKTNHTDKMMIWQESGADGARDNQAWLRIGDNSTDRLVRFDTEDSNGGNIINYGDGPESGVSNGQWHNVVCVREAGATRLYIDGELKGEMVKSVTKNVSNAEDFKIGMQEGPEGTYHTYFTGMLDDLRVYNKALTDLEVNALFKL